MTADDTSAESSGRAGTGAWLDGDVAIVSGAGTYGGSGIGNGAATAILFAEQGATVALVDKEVDWADDTKERIEEAGGEAISLRADVTDPADCRDAVDRTVKEFGSVDILHNNVGGGPMENVVDADDAAWRQSIDLNLMSVVNMSRYAIPHMIDGGGGSIVNVSSVSAMRPGLNFTPYTTTNSAVMGLTRAMAIDHARDNVRVNCVMPGPIWTPKVASSRSEAERRRRRESVPVPREGEPWDVGWAATYLASDMAGWVTGVTLPVDGGVLLTRGGNRSDMF